MSTGRLLRGSFGSGLFSIETALIFAVETMHQGKTIYQGKVGWCQAESSTDCTDYTDSNEKKLGVERLFVIADVSSRCNPIGGLNTPLIQKGVSLELSETPVKELF